MRILGINETTHDAAVTLIENGKILFAGHAERYSKQKNDWFTNRELILEALSYGKPDQIAYYEDHWLKKLRIFWYGGFGGSQPFYKTMPELHGIPVHVAYHHHSHAAAGYYTSPFKDAAVVVLDAIGEFTTSSIWVGENEHLTKVKSWRYPFSFGLFYSAFTQLIGLKPNEEEYIMMGMAAYGDKDIYYEKVKSYFPSTYKQKYNFHKGIYDWGQDITDNDKFHIAACVQRVYEERLAEFMKDARATTGKKNLVFMGGCALNCSANTMLWSIFDNVWIMPNPGDAGSSLGAAAIVGGTHLDWQNAYLGHQLGKRYPTKKIFNEIMKNKISAVATGRAEFGPRSLGNRSILADPRDPDIKNKVNKIKKREDFRPFAPVIMEEHASEWFDMDFTSPYMQFAVRCKYPEKVPSVVHHDGTSRVQTVNKKQNPGLYKLLELFYNETGIPMLLNTSLNIKGQPLLNDKNDIDEWQKTYGMEIIK